MGLRGLGFRVQGLGFKVQGLGLRVQGAGFGLQGLGIKVLTFQGLGFWEVPIVRTFVICDSYFGPPTYGNPRILQQKHGILTLHTLNPKTKALHPIIPL